ASTSSAAVTQDVQTSSLLAELTDRGLIQQLTSRALHSHLSTGSRVVYAGVDPSASSLHVGNLLPLLTLIHFARYGHNPIVLVGGATGSVGDPSGRSTERNALDPKTLQHNVDGITRQLHSFFGNNPPTETEPQPPRLGMRAILLNNLDWMKGVSLLEFLGTVGRHARLTHMLARESVASRLLGKDQDQEAASSTAGGGGGGGMSFTEFTYQLLQAYDFFHLHRTRSCTVQLGGSDQLGNISAGIDLIRRTTTFSSLPAYGVTLPLLTTSSGEKFGKSAGNAVWLDRALTSDLELYQFFARAADADVERYLGALTLFPQDWVRGIMQRHDEDRAQRFAQKQLAMHLTLLIRGETAAKRARMISEILYPASSSSSSSSFSKKKSACADVESNDNDNNENDIDLDLLAQEPGLVHSIPAPACSQTSTPDAHVIIIDTVSLLTQSKLAKSKSDAKRLLANNAVYINHVQ
ncbi:Nucleotidylyl transferase, partial [Testicularia cyperi]